MPEKQPKRINFRPKLKKGIKDTSWISSVKAEYIM